MDAKVNTGLCKHLDWDSSFFGLRIARVTSENLDNDKLNCVLDWCKNERIRCLYFLARADDDASVRLAEQNAFHLVDIRLTLHKQLATTTNGTDDGESIRPVRGGDIAALRAIARANHRDTRFYYDGHFPLERCDALYETWIERSCTGYADAVLVSEMAGAPMGYISCHRDGQGKGRIGLMGVSLLAQGQGLGSRLVAASLRWFADHGIRDVSVVTQGRNVQAQRVYQKYGFRTMQTELWYHRWFAEGTKDSG